MNFPNINLITSIQFKVIDNGDERVAMNFRKGRLTDISYDEMIGSFAFRLRGDDIAVYGDESHEISVHARVKMKDGNWSTWTFRTEEYMRTYNQPYTNSESPLNSFNQLYTFALADEPEEIQLHFQARVRFGAASYAMSSRERFWSGEVLTIPLHVPPNMHLKVNGQFREFDKGWVKIDGQYREIDELYVKVNNLWRKSE